MNKEELSNIHTQVSEFISKNKEKYDIIIDLQNILYNLTEDSYPAAIELINDNKNLFFNNHSNSIFFFCLIIKSSQFNFKHFEVNLDILLNFSPELKKCHTTDFELIGISSDFTNSLNYLFDKNFFSIESIISYSFCDAFVFINFFPEIKKEDPEYAKKHLYNFFSPNRVQNLSNYYVKDPYIRKKYLIEFLRMVQINPEEHIKNRNLNYHPSSLHKLIREDDIDSFQSYLSQNEVSVNHRIKNSYYERARTIDDSMSLIQVSAIYASIKIFKFLWLSQDIIIDENLLCYAYCGYNFDIIHLCESKCSYDKVYLQPIALHQDNLLDYFIENFRDEIKEDEKFKSKMKDFENDENNLYQTHLNYASIEMAFYSLNYNVILNCLEKIVYIARNIQNVESNDGDNLISHIACIDFDLFHFIYCQRKPNIDKCKCGSHNKLLYDSIKLCKNDVAIFIFNDMKKIDYIFILLSSCLKYNHDIANYILDLQLEEKKKNCNGGPIFSEFYRNIYKDFLHEALRIYDEDIIVKMIKLYNFFDQGYASIFIQHAFELLSSKMIVSLLKKLATFVRKNDMLLMMDILRGNDPKYISIFQQHRII